MQPTGGVLRCAPFYIQQLRQEASTRNLTISPTASIYIIAIKEMAEIFGTVASALSVAALFNNCVDCFEYIQLGRRFGQDYERPQLKVDIAKTRLSRWGEAVAIHRDSRFTTAMPGSDQNGPV